MAEEHKDNERLYPEGQTTESSEGELAEDALDEVSGGRGVNAGAKVCRNCGAKYLKSSAHCPLCGSKACTTVSFR